MKGENGQMYPYLDLTNERFGRLVALKISGRDKNRHLMWECVCDCGNIKNIAGTSLIEKYTTSCGCYHRETKSKYNKKHGKSGHKIYKVWLSMKSRCYGNDKKYEKNYKGRIFVCDRWMDSFQNFFDDMFLSYKEGLSLDRINNDGDYCPENCRWTTPEVQSNNKSNNIKYTVGNETHSAKEWEKITGIDRALIARNIKRGVPVQEAIYGKPVTSLSQISQYLVF